MKQIPIKFVKPNRGEHSHSSIYIEVNYDEAGCLCSGGIGHINSDGSNGVLVIDETDTDCDEI